MLAVRRMKQVDQQRSDARVVALAAAASFDSFDGDSLRTPRASVLASRGAMEDVPLTGYSHVERRTSHVERQTSNVERLGSNVERRPAAPVNPTPAPRP